MLYTSLYTANVAGYLIPYAPQIGSVIYVVLLPLVTGGIDMMIAYSTYVLPKYMLTDWYGYDLAEYQIITD